MLEYTGSARVNLASFETLTEAQRRRVQRNYTASTPNTQLIAPLNELARQIFLRLQYEKV